MKIEAMRCFCAVVEEHSFRAAADRLHRSQPAVSQQIKTLEGEVGHTLLERRSCRPTPAGHLLYDRARHILNEAESLAREVADYDEAQVQALRVGTSDTTALYILPPIIGAFSRAMPQTRLVLVNRPSAAIADQVRLGELDLGIVTLPVAREELEERDLFEQELILTLPRLHPLASRQHVELAELHDEPMLLLDDTTRTGHLLRAYLRDADYEPLVVLDSGSFEVIKRYVGEGIGISFLPRIAVTRKDVDIATAAVHGLPSIRIGAIWRRGAYQSRAERTFLDLVAREKTGTRTTWRNKDRTG